MSIFSKLFKRSQSNGEISVPAETVHFMYVSAAGRVAENFQISELDAERATVALDGEDFFYFTTLLGRQCSVNFKLVQAVHIYQAAKIASSDWEIDGIVVYLAGERKYRDIPCDQLQMEHFFRQLKVGASFAQLGEWHIRTSDIVVVVASNAPPPKNVSDSITQHQLCDHDWQPDGQTMTSVRWACTKCHKTQSSGLEI